LPFGWFGCETSSLALREEYQLQVSENKAPTKIYWPKKDEVGVFVIRNFIICTDYLVLLVWWNLGGYDARHNLYGVKLLTQLWVNWPTQTNMGSQFTSRE